jgi:phosphohistidine phosphatase
MRRLFIVRHAAAIGPQEQPLDEERMLSETGLAQAEHISAHLVSLGVQPDAIISSPAKRALETARILAAALEFPLGQIQIVAEAYLATSVELHDLVVSVAEEVVDLILVGHNPGISALVSLFTGSEIGALPPGGAVCISFEALPWRDVGPNSGQLLPHFGEHTGGSRDLQY